MQLGAIDFRPERDNTRFKLLDRQRVEVMPGKRIQRIARPTRECLVGLHVVKVDPVTAIVNPAMRRTDALSGKG